MQIEGFPQILREMSFLCELKGENPFKIRALENGARALEDTGKSLDALWDSGEIKKIPGVGKGTQAMAKEFLDSGLVKEHQDLKADFPGTIFEILEVQGLGPKKCKALYDQLQIASLAELEYACLENRLLDLKGFGEKTQANILKSITQIKSNRGKVILPMALQEAQEIADLLQDIPGVEKVSETGALRRRMEVISELEFLVSGDEKKIQMACAKKNWAKNEKGFSFQTERGLRVQLFLVNSSQFGSELFKTTGPAEFTSKWKIENSALEMAIFEKNNAEYIPPECRDLPLDTKDLIEEKQIKGVFHLHTKWSDGSNTLEEMVLAAIDRGWEYLGVSEHSQSAFYANGLKEERVLEQKKEIEKLQKKYSIRIFHGIESDILVDGSLDYSASFLKHFDFVIASVHGQMRMKREEMTKRLCAALENPATTWLGHWSGRLLMGREGYEFDHEKVLKVAAKMEKGIELNSNPYRLDLDWREIPMAAKLGVNIGIFPDAHSVGGFNDVKYGILMARKAGLKRSQVINTKTAKEMETWLQK